MKILITGAFGQIGLSILNFFCLKENKKKLVDKFGSLTIICYDLHRRKTKRAARKFRKYNFIKIIYGDIRDKDSIAKVIDSVDIVFHLAFQLPPIPDENEPKIREINVGGLANIVELIARNDQKTKIIYPSSIDMYGHVPKEKQPIIPGSETHPTDHYGRHKVECLKLLEKSGLDYTVFVLTVVPPLHYLAQNPAMFDVEVDSNVELVHEEDVALAFFNALFTEEIWFKTLHISGGSSCRLSYIDFINKMMIASGIGSLDRELFQGKLYHFAFMDTTESQKILNFQKHSTDDIIEDMKKNNRFTFFIIRVLKPIVRRFLINQSPYR